MGSLPVCLCRYAEKTVPNEYGTTLPVYFPLTAR